MPCSVGGPVFTIECLGQKIEVEPKERFFKIKITDSMDGSDFDIVKGDRALGVWVSNPDCEIRTDISIEKTHVVVFDRFNTS